MRRPGARRSISLPEEQWEALREIGEREDRSVNSVIRVAINDWIGGGQLVRSRARGRISKEGSDPQKLVSATIEETEGVPANLKSAEPGETRDPDDEEARLLRESFPHLKKPKIIR